MFIRRKALTRAFAFRETKDDLVQGMLGDRGVRQTGAKGKTNVSHITKEI